MGKVGMAAAVFADNLSYVTDHALPDVKPGWARIRVQVAGICKTDMEIMKGYLGFRGVLGHEFVGFVDRCDDPALLGRRVVGEINASCGRCAWCVQSLGRHCPERTTLGIVNHDGCMAEFCTLPLENLFVVPEQISAERAVMTEPLAAACEILEQLAIKRTERIVVLGDGRLGILCAWALATVAADITIIGHHPEKLSVASWRAINTADRPDEVPSGADIVVEATGSGRGISQAMALCRARGTIVLKSTMAIAEEVNLSPAVINEQMIVGSRCGRFKDALAMMQNFPDMPLENLVTGRYPLRNVEEAFVRAQQKDALKVLLDVVPDESGESDKYPSPW